MAAAAKCGQVGPALLREALLGLLIALFLLSGLAAMRAKAEGAVGGFARHASTLCLSDEGGAPPADHDCDACRLVQGPLLAPPLRVAALADTAENRAAPCETVEPVLPTACRLPWSRGPPGAA